MKTITLALLTVAAFLCLGGVSPNSGPVGRYQLHSGQTTAAGIIEGQSVNNTSHVILKIDTVTGETWRWKQFSIGTKMVIGWVHCKDVTDFKISDEDYERLSNEKIK